MAIYISEEDNDHNYVLIKKSILENSDLNLEEKGLLAFIYRLHESDLTYNPQTVGLKESYDEVLPILKKLVSLGYLKLVGASNE